MNCRRRLSSLIGRIEQRPQSNTNVRRLEEMMTTPSSWRLSLAGIALAFVFGATLTSCDAGGGGAKRRHLSNTGRSVFFTDRRGLDRELVDEDIQRLTDAISDSPEDSRLLVARGFIHAALTDFTKAIEDFEEATRLNPNTDAANPNGPDKNSVEYLLALAHWQNGLPEKAVGHFSAVVQSNPTYARALFYRGLASLEAGDRATALRDVEAAARQDSERMYQKVLDELKGAKGRERIFASYVMCFHSNKPPQNRPFGYVWEIQHQVP